MQSNTTTGSADSTEILNTLDVLASHWPPADPELLAYIQAGLLNGRYQKAPETLISDLKKDVTLFLFCIRALSQTSNQTRDAAKLLREIPINELSKILPHDVTEISNHSFETSSLIQHTALVRSSIVATVAEHASVEVSVDSELAYTYSLLTQFGLTLIAWAYPNIYRQAIANKCSIEELDKILTDTLGFSPSLVGIRLANSWGLMLSGDRSNETNITSHEELLASNLERLCRIGEAFAFASLPDDSKAPDWDSAIRTIEATLGESGVASLKVTLKERLSVYLCKASDLFQWGVPPTGKAKKIKVSKDKLLTNNVYIKHCTTPVQEALAEVYAKLKTKKATINLEEVRTITEKIMPQSGFVGGAIFLVVPHRTSLVPRYVFGSFPKKLRTPFDYSNSSDVAHPFIKAFRANAPVIFKEDSDDKVPNLRYFQIVVGVLGEIHRTGLFAAITKNTDEINDLSQNSPPSGSTLASHSIVLSFKAIRMALEDCLDIH
jgi:hypothetical protein